MNKANSQNLVPNSSFEVYSNCPTGGGEVNKAFPWVDPTGSTSDYFNSCSTTPGLPNNFGGFQYARTGNAYMGLNAYVSTWLNFRDYIQVPLDSTLQSGKKYCVIFYINLTNASKYAIDGIGAYFSVSAITCGSPPCLLSYSAQINGLANNIISDTLNWIKIKGNFTAVGGEKYMTIGNFKDDSNTDTMTVYSGASNSSAYYYIDDVSVMLCDDTLSVTDKMKDDFTFNLYPNPSNGNILLKYNIKQGDVAVIKIYDVTGKLIEEEELNSNTNELQLSTILTNGVYLYQVFVNDKVVKRDKLVIIKER